MKRVKNWQSVITALTHGLTFADDATVNQNIITKYFNYVFVFDAVEDQSESFKAVINEFSQRANELYETTQYDYNPIENYNRVETGTDTRTDNLAHSAQTTRTDNIQTSTSSSTTNTTTDLTSVHRDAGYTSGSDTTVTSSDTQSGTVNNTGSASGSQTGTVGNVGSSTDTGTVTNQHNLTITGNIGTMSTQEMIERQRNIILDVLQWYVDKFADCFDLCGLHHLSYKEYEEEIPDDITAL